MLNHMHRGSLLTAEQMRQADARAIERLGNGLPLMQEAGKQVFDYIMQCIEAPTFPPKVLVICGVGNNGGDGFIIAQHFLKDDVAVDVLLLGNASSMRETASQAFDDLPKSCLIEAAEAQWNEYTLIVDALFGIGLDRDITGDYADVIEQANRCETLRIAVDIPSGVHTDNGQIMGTAFKADHTVTFFAAKPGHYLQPGKAHCGQIHIADIGIEAGDCDHEALWCHLNHPDCWQDKLVKPNIDQHKYHRGHSIIIGAEMPHAGSAKLAALAALRTGSGLVSIACSQQALPAYAQWATAVMTKPYMSESGLEAIIEHPKTTAIAYGMGAGIGELTKERTLKLLQTGKPCVLDADALSAFEGDFKHLQLHLHEHAVLTPHEGEFSRLFRDVINLKKPRLARVIEAASLTGATIILKGNDSIIASPQGKIYINYTAPSHLATAGSGDVLSGIIIGLLAQANPIFEAAACAVWKHSEAANHYQSGMIADDIILGLRK